MSLSRLKEISLTMINLICKLILTECMKEDGVVSLIFVTTIKIDCTRPAPPRVLHNNSSFVTRI